MEKASLTARRTAGGSVPAQFQKDIGFSAEFCSFAIRSQKMQTHGLFIEIANATQIIHGQCDPFH